MEVVWTEEAKEVWGQGQESWQVHVQDDAGAGVGGNALKCMPIFYEWKGVPGKLLNDSYKKRWYVP